MAYVIPFHIKGSRGPQALFIILTKENLDRMQGADPFDIQLTAYKNQIDLSQPLRNLDIVIAYEEDEEAIRKFAALGDLKGIIRFLERGRVHRPGDAEPPISVKGPQ